MIPLVYYPKQELIPTYFATWGLLKTDFCSYNAYAQSINAASIIFEIVTFLLQEWSPQRSIDKNFVSGRTAQVAESAVMPPADSDDLWQSELVADQTEDECAFNLGDRNIVIKIECAKTVAWSLKTTKIKGNTIDQAYVTWVESLVGWHRYWYDELSFRNFIFHYELSSQNEETISSS